MENLHTLSLELEEEGNLRTNTIQAVTKMDVVTRDCTPH